jgi:hypothetical protein
VSRSAEGAQYESQGRRASRCSVRCPWKNQSEREALKERNNHGEYFALSVLSLCLFCHQGRRTSRCSALALAFICRTFGAAQLNSEFRVKLIFSKTEQSSARPNNYLRKIEQVINPQAWSNPQRRKTRRGNAIRNGF